MGSIVQRLAKQGLLTPPLFLAENVQYETMMGSEAYGVSSANSDIDVYGFCLPPKDMIFPHLRGEILGFGNQTKRFEQYQQHHIKEASSGKEYDITIYSIVKYFQLCMENNPNMIDSLFTPQRCVLHVTQIGNLVRDNRRAFLHKGSWHKFKGYAYSQLHKARTKSPDMGSKRAALREQFGFDVKFLYHVVRLLNEAEQILIEGDLDLERNREQLKAIRRGEVSEEEIRAWASDKERELESAYISSNLRHKPDQAKIKQLLLDCLESHYGDLSTAIVSGDKATIALWDIRKILENVGC